MAEEDERSMIGYDPLAWLHDNEPAEPVAENKDTLLSDKASGKEHVVGREFTETDASYLDADCNLEEVDHESPQADSNELMHKIGGSPSLIEVENLETTLALSNGIPNLNLAASAGQVMLEASQTIQNVGELHQQLRHLLDIGSNIDIDASAVTQIDTATMQLLLVLKLTAANLQKEINIDFPSDRFLEAAKLLGVAEILSVDQAASGFF